MMNVGIVAVPPRFGAARARLGVLDPLYRIGSARGTFIKDRGGGAKR